jgi:hypothetical protein
MALDTSINLLRDLIAALRGTRFLAYPMGMSRRSVPCALHSSRSLRFFEVSGSFVKGEEGRCAIIRADVSSWKKQLSTEDTEGTERLRCM